MMASGEDAGSSTSRTVSGPEPGRCMSYTGMYKASPSLSRSASVSTQDGLNFNY